MNCRSLALLAATAALVSSSAFAWDPAGHMLVDQVAWEHCSQKARDQVTDLVKDLDSRFNGARPYNFITAGTWMDDMRELGSEYKWARLHYVTIKWTPSGLPAPIPAPPNVVAGIEDTVATLSDPAATREQKVEAIGMLMHFVGDIHQPLHTTDRNNDRGGNAYLITGVPFSDLLQKQGNNLHTYWDKAFRFDVLKGKIFEVWKAPKDAERPTGPGDGIIAAQAKKIMAAHPRPGDKDALRYDATAWAQESHAIGCKMAYPPGEPPPNTEVGVLTPDFVQERRPIAEGRIALAGYRLAFLLDRIFGQ